LCAGLEIALRNGTAVKQYYYLDTNPASRQTAAHRLQQLMALYPLLLPACLMLSPYLKTYASWPQAI
jgi:hypothetical protein